MSMRGFDPRRFPQVAAGCKRTARSTGSRTLVVLDGHASRTAVYVGSKQ